MSTTVSMKLWAFAMVCVAALMLSPFAHAEVASTTASTTPVVTTPAPTSPTIAALMAQLSRLTELFNQLKAQMTGMKAEITALREGIKEGSRGDDVREIQEILASDHLIYPAGLTTGFFGPLTTEAIKKFQSANGLTVTGVIDDATKAALDTIREQRKIDGKIPFGLLMAPGLRGKFEDKMQKKCEHVVASSTASSTNPNSCMHFENHGDKMHGDDDSDDDNANADDDSNDANNEGNHDNTNDDGDGN